MEGFVLKACYVSVLAAAFAGCGAPQSAIDAPLQVHPKVDNVGDIELTIIRGTEIPRSKAPPSFGYTTSDGSGCSGQWVSENTVGTAAHCVSSSRTVGSAKLADGTPFTFTGCVKNPRYSGNPTADHAFCKASVRFPGTAYTLVTDKNEVKVGDIVRQIGVGCDRWGKSDFGRFQWALEKLIGLPSGSSRDFTTLGRANTPETPGAPCSGDSGGTLLTTVRDALGKITDALGKLLGFTSRSNTVDEGYFSGFTHPDDQAWIRSLESSNGLTACGLSPGATGCGAPDPTPTPTPPGPTPTPPGPTPEPTPPPPAPSVNACKGALKLLDAKLFHKPYGDGTAELKLLAACNALAKPMPEMARQ